MRLDTDQSRTLQRNTLMDLPSLLPALPYTKLFVRHRVHAHSDAAHTPMHSISLYLGLTLVKSYLIYIWQHFDGESKAQTKGEN